MLSRCHNLNRLRGLFSRVLLLILVGLAGCNQTARTGTVDEGESSERRISFLFGGDLMQHMSQMNAARRDTGFDYSGSFRYIAPYIDSVDFTILNFETTVSATGEYSGYPMFASPVALVEALREYGVDAVTLATNHIVDKGRRGLGKTIAVLEQNNIRYMGVFPDSVRYEAYNPLYFEKEGIRVAMLNYGYGMNGLRLPEGAIFNELDTVRMAADLAKIDRDKTDYVIVCLHWGHEYQRQPSPDQRSLAEWCHNRGVDFIIGSHPHVLQPIEAKTDANGSISQMTVYSLGNLVSNQRWRYSDGGMLVRLEIIHQDGKPNRIEAGYMLAWVDLTLENNGHKAYRILPASAADTVIVNRPDDRKEWEQFLSDSRKLLKDSVPVKEIK